MALVSVLVVDEDEVALAPACALLRTAGYVVDEVVGGRRALERIKAGAPAVLVTKILMPDGDGIELITAVKSSYPSIRILALGNRRFLGELDLFALVRKLGADAVLDQPLQSELLLAAVARLSSCGQRS